ncbi:eukaryotic translation initiation factor 4H [Elysia marginata]|uniref:Eukaryotic translation initiation factor 4H n=1 Tax=Elysia marginata TaxID=1093978 RepID=A0AAV4IS23_9GAST|nr:eukaryotic translation initiation factor 4H [Elysia marginata]
MALPPDLPVNKLQSALDSGKGGNTSRKERRKDWWQKKKSVASKNGKSESVKQEDKGEEGQRVKLRNRETIAKPDSLKYEPNINKGFKPKVMQSLNINTPNKNKRKSGQPRPPANEITPGNPAKRKSSDVQQQVPSSPSKKPKPSSEPEVFDSYKFSLELINGEVSVPKDMSGKDSKNKYVLFIGNLPYDITREQLEEHFRKTGGIKSIRIPREKETDKGRGFAYMEFDGRISHGIALRLHQTTLGGRKINVEFTSIGGGKSEARKEKLKQKNIKRRKMKTH